MTKKLLLIDNYDSFSFNLFYYFCELGVRPVVVKNDFAPKLTKEVRDFVADFEYIVISPGFGSPKDSLICLEILKEFSAHKKILGVCLGMQCIASVFGGKVSEMPSPMHAKSALCEFRENALTRGIPNPFKVGLYHSLFVEKCGECEILGFAKIAFDTSKVCTKDIPMILKHKEYSVYGVQFHPESLLSTYGKELLQNFLAL
ncbi:anthranilate synthase component II [Helicobacter himalayensis]|uniref:anthranilate synthase component II n=1 Tax=Helicobacter himalayensis TaxID=1591088 RepID=UPI003D6F540D